jgi:Tol biopolymer transport system component
VLQVYVRNVSRGTTSLISHGPGGAPGNNVSFAGGMSPGGRYVIFASYASNLVAGDTNAHEDVFVRDRRLGTTHRVDLGRGGVQANGDAFAVGISAGGRYRVFASHASNLVAGDTNGAWDIFVRDRHTGKTVRVDLTATGGQANHGIGRVSFGATALTAGARWLAFVSPSTNLHPPNANSLIHTYLRGPIY